MKNKKLHIRKFVPRTEVKEVFDGDENHARCPICGYITHSFNGLVDNFDGTWCCVRCPSKINVHPEFFIKAMDSDDIPGWR